VPGKDGFVGAATGWLWANDTPGAVFDPAGDSEDDIVTFPMMRMVKAAPYNLWWLGRLANGSDITPGNYRYGPVISSEWAKCYHPGSRR
jgi:hypothetical protein